MKQELVGRAYSRAGCAALLRSAVSDWCIEQRRATSLRHRLASTLAPPRACLAVFRQRNRFFGYPSPPHPGPLPVEREKHSSPLADAKRTWEVGYCNKDGNRHPLSLKGEGEGNVKFFLLRRPRIAPFLQKPR